MEAAKSAPAEYWKHLKSERRVALGIAAVVAAVGVVWMSLTDLAIYWATSNPVLVGRLETAKGWLFVLFAALVVYLVARRSAARMIRAHAAISAVVDSIGDGILLLGRDRHIAYANPAAVRMLRCDGMHQLVGMGPDTFSRRFRVSYMNGALVPPQEFASQRVFDEGGPLRYKALLHPPQGGETVILVVAAAVRIRAGTLPDVVVSVMHDITDSENLERLRDQFLGAAAHALKTPVAVIKTNAQLMSRHCKLEHARQMAAIVRQCSRIDRMVQNMLVLSRARSQSLRLYLDEIELVPLVAAVAREMAADERRNDIRPEVEASPRVRADPERLALVLRNVIGEAQRGSVAGTPVTVGVTQQGPDAEIIVRYQALPEEEGPFAAGGEYDNLGVGRWVAETIVEAHGGALREERSGPAASATIRLPASPLEATP